uniref:C-type lectin domain-containing protein n=1 Tax=Oryzias latipes TaxID=8090 RepID=A0A3P9M732_ORYLA
MIRTLGKHPWATKPTHGDGRQRGKPARPGLSHGIPQIQIFIESEKHTDVSPLKMLSSGLFFIHSIEKDLFLNPTISEVFYFYVAVTEQNQKVYFYIGQSRSWSSAQNYCRENYLDLAMIENQEENTRAGTWIGLYREPWTWSDGSKSSFRNWYPTTGINNIDGKQHCGTENPKHVWCDEDCSIKRVFVCHQGENVKKY